MIRHDYAYPFRIDGDSSQAQQSVYAAHVRQMIRQVLLTTSGERIDLPEFGCGLRQALFAPNSDELKSSVKILILQSLDRWLGSHIKVKEVNVESFPEAGELRIDIDYLLLETQSGDRTAILVK